MISWLIKIEPFLIKNSETKTGFKIKNESSIIKLKQEITLNK